MKKKLPVILLIIVVLLAGIVAGGFGYVKVNSKSVASKDSENLQTVDFEVKNGMSAKAVGKELKKLGLIKNADIFYMFARYPKAGAFFTGKDSSVFKIQTGYYELSPAMDLAEIFSVICTGKEKSVDVVIPEGLTITKVAERLRTAGLKNVDDFEQVAASEGRKIFEAHGLKIKADSVEGFLYPDTYNIPLSYDSEKIIGLMIDNLMKNITSYKETDGIQNKSDFYDLMILASIIEREYRVKEEARSIAGVFKNRLSINMPLQSCATVEYIITEINHKPHPDRIYFSDLESTSAYNTYKYPGLPPGPISNPGITAIRAAANPEKNNYLYFTLTDVNAGRHTFSSSLEAHNKATNEFRTKRDANN